MRPDVLFATVVIACLTFPMLAFGLYWLYNLKRNKHDDSSAKVLKQMAKENHSNKENKTLEQVIGKHKITFDSVYEALKPDLFPKEK